MLDEVGEQYGAARAMEKDNLDRDPVTAHLDLVDGVRPGWIGRIVQVAVEGEVGATGAQAGAA
jgi:hypothetical protein